MRRKLTPQSSLENLKREVKRWLKAIQAGDPAARARFDSDRTPVVITSADAHYSIARAAAIMGIHDLRKVPTDAQHRMDVGALEELLAALDAPPLAIVATSGSTATGAFEP